MIFLRVRLAAVAVVLCVAGSWLAQGVLGQGTPCTCSETSCQFEGSLPECFCWCDEYVQSNHLDPLGATCDFYPSGEGVPGHCYYCPPPGAASVNATRVDERGEALPPPQKEAPRVHSTEAVKFDGQRSSLHPRAPPDDFPPYVYVCANGRDQLGNCNTFGGGLSACKQWAQTEADLPGGCTGNYTGVYDPADPPYSYPTCMLECYCYACDCSIYQSPNLPPMMDSDDDDDGHGDVDAFEEFKRAFGKQYASPEEEARRRRVFAENRALILAHPESMELNEFADMAMGEFAAKRGLMRNKRRAPEHPQWRFADAVSRDAIDGLPTAFDWRNATKPVVTPVRDQGSVGTCWAVSTVENVEGQWAAAGNSLVELSVEQVVDCCAVTDPHSENACCGVFGGWPYLAYNYVMEKGLEQATEYPYCCGTGNCYPCAPPGYNKSDCGEYTSYCQKGENKCTGVNATAHIKDWVAVSADENQIAAQLYQRGPLSVVFDATWLQFYKPGTVWQPGSACSTTDLDHAVLIVGWGVQDTVPYWSVKNSWGTSFGDAGYFKIIRGAGECGINTAVTSATM